MKDNNQANSEKQGLQNKSENAQNNETVSALKDGFRYDYNDSSDFKEDKMS